MNHRIDPIQPGWGWPKDVQRHQTVHWFEQDGRGGMKSICRYLHYPEDAATLNQHLTPHRHCQDCLRELKKRGVRIPAQPKRSCGAAQLGLGVDE